MSCTKSGELRMATKKPKRIEKFQILDLMQAIHYAKSSDEDDWDSDEQYAEHMEELNAKLNELLDRLVALQ